MRRQQSIILVDFDFLAIPGLIAKVFVLGIRRAK